MWARKDLEAADIWMKELVTALGTGNLAERPLRVEDARCVVGEAIEHVHRMAVLTGEIGETVRTETVWGRALRGEDASVVTLAKRALAGEREVWARLAPWEKGVDVVRGRRQVIVPILRDLVAVERLLAAVQADPSVARGRAELHHCEWLSRIGAFRVRLSWRGKTEKVGTFTVAAYGGRA
jgi:hypothetical protein